MPQILLGRAAYERAQLAPTTLKNMFYERAPTNLTDQTALMPRPRLKAFSTPGSGPIRGLYRKGGVMGSTGNSGAILALSGSQLYLVDQTNGSSSSLGSVSGQGLRMSAEGDADRVVLTTGGNLYSTNGEDLQTIDIPEGFAAYAVDTLNGYFLVASDNGRFYWLAPGENTIDPLAFATAESQPDLLLSLKVAGDELWLFGRLSVEVWQPTADPDLPFQQITGRVFGVGVTARDTVQKLNVDGLDTVCWLGTDRRVYRTQPNPVRISDSSLEEKLARASVSLTDNSLNPYASTCSWEGHDFYILHIPREGSFAYDLSTGCWEEWTSHGQPLFRGAVAAVGPNAQPLLGDAYDDRIWELTSAQTTDGADPVLFEFGGLLEVTGGPMRCANVMLDVATGDAASPLDDPVISLSTSQDLGASESEPVAAPLGRQGERHMRLRWTRLGQLRHPGAAFTWRTTHPVTVRAAHFNETLRR